MGASASAVNLASIKLTDKEYKHATKELFEQKVFDAFADADHLISLEALQGVLSEKTDVFLTHDWGNENGVDNHARVSRVNDALKARGLRTWFDADKMEGNVKKKMITGIENAFCIAVFVTKRYMSKVECDNAEDNCQLEFNYASRRKTGRKMVPVVMEAQIKDANEWTGEVGMVLGGSLYVDLATDDSFEARMDELHSRILGVTGTTIQKVLEDDVWRELIQSKLHGPAPATPAAAAPAPAASPQHKAPAPAPAAAHSDQPRELDELEAEMASWISSHTKIARKFVLKYVMLLSDAGIGSIDKLAKKLTRNADYLDAIQMDEDDAEELAIAVMSIGRKVPEVVAVVSAAPNIADRDFKNIFEFYYHSRILSKDGKDQLIAFAADESDQPRCMLAKGMLSICFSRGGGLFTPADESRGIQCAKSCYAYLKENAYQPSEDAISPSDIVQRPMSFGALAAWAAGSIVKDGLGVPKDVNLGYKFIEVACLQGLMIAYNTLGIMIENGQGAKKDSIKATQYYRLAAEKTFAISQYNMGHVYCNTDINEAMRFYKLAAAQGYPEAIFRIGNILLNGWFDVRKDTVEGKRMIKEAASRGSSDAAALLKTI